MRKRKSGVVAILAAFMGLSLGVAVWALSGGGGASGAVGAAEASARRASEREHRPRQWAAPGSRARTGWSEGPRDLGAPVVDPQVAAYQRSWRRFGDAGPGGRTPDFSPTTHLGVLRSVEGEAPVGEGARCEVRLLPVLSSLFNCVVRVACDDVVLYPDEAQEAGYAPCDVSDGVALRATDDGITAEDGDPRVDVDVAGRRVRVHDHGPGVAPFSADIGLVRLM